LKIGIITIYLTVNERVQKLEHQKLRKKEKENKEEYTWDSVRKTKERL